jgi:acetyl-CoA carboxylase carboxyl transferase subunit alpha
MSQLPVPIISIVIGEGGSGGALGIGVCDRLLLLENSYYSVISPEGCAAILFRDSAKAKEAAEAMKITAGDILRLGCADEIIPEPFGGAQSDIITTAKNIKEAIRRHLTELTGYGTKKLLSARYKKYRTIGENGGKNNGAKKH